MSRLRPGEQKAYESAFRAYNQALEHANIDRNAMNHKPYSLTAADIEGFRRVIQGSHMTMLALPTDDDVGLAMDVKMEIKDACARCLAQRLGGTRLFGQVSFAWCGPSDATWNADCLAAETRRKSDLWRSRILATFQLYVVWGNHYECFRL